MITFFARHCPLFWKSTLYIFDFRKTDYDYRKNATVQKTCARQFRFWSYISWGAFFFFFWNNFVDDEFASSFVIVFDKPIHQRWLKPTIPSRDWISTIHATHSSIAPWKADFFSSFHRPSTWPRLLYGKTRWCGLLLLLPLLLLPPHADPNKML